MAPTRTTIAPPYNVHTHAHATTTLTAEHNTKRTYRKQGMGEQEAAHTGSARGTCGHGWMGGSRHITHTHTNKHTHKDKIGSRQIMQRLISSKGALLGNL